MAHEPDEVEAEPPVLMVELQDLVDGHHAEIDLSLADRRVHPLARRREDADLSEHGARAELDRNSNRSEPLNTT